MDTDPQVIEFLRQSNAIENVWGDKPLKQALKAWVYLTQWDKLTKQNILKTHACLMKKQLDPQAVGAWRRRSVWIGGQEAKPSYVIPNLMDFWLREANQIPKTETAIQQDHITFENIHPFLDGNGRVGRIILNWQRIKSNLPILIIKEAEKFAYYAWFKKQFV